MCAHACARREGGRAIGEARLNKKIIVEVG